MKKEKWKNRYNSIKKFVKDVKNLVKKNIQKAFADKILEKIVCIVLVGIGSFFCAWIFKPQMKIKDIQIEVLSDKLVLTSGENWELGKEFTISETITDSEIRLEDTCSYYAPELQIEFKGHGKIKAAYIVYEQNEVENPGELLIQKVSVHENWRMHFHFIPRKCTVICNYVNKANDSTKFMYLVLVGDDDVKNIFCIYINMNDENVTEIMNIEDIYEILPNSKSIFGLNKVEIQKDVEDIKKMILN